MKYRKSLFASIIMIVCGALILGIVPLVMGDVASQVNTTEGADNSWWRTLWYISLTLGYSAYVLLILGVSLLVVTVVRELRFHKEDGVPNS